MIIIYLVYPYLYIGILKNMYTYFVDNIIFKYFKTISNYFATFKKLQICLEQQNTSLYCYSFDIYL